MTEMLKKEFSRKSFVKGGGALIVGFSIAGAGVAGKASAAKTPNVPPDPRQVDTFLAINADNTVTLYPPKNEFGQGTWTGFRQLVAEELDVPVTSVRIPPVWDSGSANPFPDLGFTAGSKGMAQGGPPVRQAAAEARRALLNLASASLGAPVASLSVSSGVVSGGGRSIKYGDLLGGKLFNTTIQLDATTIAPLKPVSQYKVVGTSVPRFDIPDIVTGKFTYLQNVRVPGMLHGRPVRPRGQASVYGQSPEGGPASFTLLNVDESSIKNIPEAQVVRRGNFVGVVAPTEYAAIQAAAQLKVKWGGGETLPGSGNQYRALRSSPVKGEAVVLNYGNVDNALRSAAKVLTATYEWPFQMHGPLGPVAAIADVRPDGATIFTSGQWSWGSRTWVAQTLGLPATSVRVVSYMGASTYGPDNHNLPPVDAAIMSQIVGKPVRVQWMRWDSHGWESYGINYVADITGGLDASGRIVAYDFSSVLTANSGNDLSAPPGIVQVGLPIPAEAASSGGSTRGAPSRMPGITSVNAPGGRFESFSTGDQYFPNLPNRRVRGKTVSRLLTVSPLRAPSVAQPSWASESMIDELAYAANMDALAFRQAHCTHDGWRPVLDMVAKAANWQPRVSASQLSKGRLLSGRGIAIAGENHANDDVYSGVVAEVQVDRKTGGIRVTHLYGAQGSGVVVNPALAENQISGMLVRGTSRTLMEEVMFSKQRVTSIDWVSYPTLRFRDSPKVTSIVISHPDEIADLASTNIAGYAGPRYRGVGESLEAAVPAAIGNAVFDAIGVRMRQIPLTPAKVRNALAAAGRLYKA